MTLSLSEFGNTVSKLDALEGQSITLASIDDSLGRPPQSITSERIARGELLLETYRVVGDAIHGGMGSVWRVRHIGWGVDLAMKRPQPRFFAEASRARKEDFIAECETWIGLGLHPNIVTCHYVREIGGVPSIFSEWMDGGSLADRIRDGTLYDGGAEEVRARLPDIAIQAARGLLYAHRQGLMHQDVKPGNILLGADWEAKLADFGLAKARASLEAGAYDSAEEYGAPRSGGCTREYCPPEQADGAEAELWMDAWALALTVLEMYLGERPWASGGDAFRWFREEYPAYRQGRGARAELPEPLAALLADPEPTLRRADGMDLLERALVESYRRATGRDYPRKAPEALENRAGTLNNMALSFLDLGKPNVARSLLASAADADPRHPDIVYNRELLRWRDGDSTDDRAINEVRALRALDDSAATAMLEAQLELERGMRSGALAILDSLDDAEATAALRDAALRLPEDAWQVLPTPMDGGTDWNSAIPGASGDAVWLANGEQGALLVGLDGSVRRRLPGVYRIDALSDDEGLIAAVEAIGVGDGQARPRERGYCCNVYDAATGERVASFDAGLCAGGCGLYFLDEGRLLAVVGVDSEVVGYNEYEDCDETRDVSDEYIRVYDVRTGEKVCAINKDLCRDGVVGRGRYLVEAMADGNADLFVYRARTLALRDARTGQVLRTLERIDSPVNRMLFSADGNALYAMSADGWLREYAIPEGRLLRKKQVHKPGVAARILGMCPNGRMITGGGEGTARVWDADGRCLVTLRHEGGVWLDAEGGSVLCGGYRSGGYAISRFRVHAGAYRAPWALARVRGVSEQLSDEQRFRQAMDDAWQARRDEDYARAYALCCRAREVPGYEYEPRAVRFCRDMGAYGTQAGLRSVRRTATWQPGTRFEEQSMEFSWDDRLLLCLRGSALMVLDAGNLRRMYTFRPKGESVADAASIPMSDKLFVNTDGGAYLLDAASGAPVRKLDASLAGDRYGLGAGAAASPDGKLLAVSTAAVTGGLFRKKQRVNRIQLRALDTGKRLFSWDLDEGEYCGGLRFAPDGRRLYAATGAALYEIDWSAPKADAVRRFAYSAYMPIGRDNTQSRLDISPDGRLALIRTGQRLLLFDLADRRELLSRMKLTPGMTEARLVGDSRMLLCAWGDSTLRLLALDDQGRLDERFRLSEPLINRIGALLAVSGDGTAAAVGAADNGVLRYELEWRYAF